MDRAPGLSVRLKLTLSYAGFLMAAGAVLLTASWVYLTRVPHVGLILDPDYERVVVREFAPTAAVVMAFLLVLGLGGGWLLAGRMLSPWPASRTPRASRRPGRSPTGSGYRVAATSSASSPTPSTPCSRGSRRRSPNSSGSRPTPRTSCAPRWRSRRRCSTSPATIRPAATTSWSSASTSSTPGRSTSPKPCSCSAAPTSAPSPESPSTCPSIAEEAAETLLPLAEGAAPPSRPPATRPPPSAHPPCCCR